MKLNYKFKSILIFGALFLSLSSMIGCNSKNNDNKAIHQSKNSKGYENIDSKETEELSNQTENVLVIDVRDDDEYDRGHLVNAINIPYDDDFKSELRDITDYKDKTVLIYGNSGNKSEQAAGKLVDNGFKNVKNSTKGIDEYNYNLVKVENITGKEAEEIIRDAKNNKIDFDDDYDGNDELIIIDVRSEEDFKNGHIENAINIPFEEFDNRINELNNYRNKEVIIYSTTGRKSADAGEILVQNRFNDVDNVVDGVKEYNFKLVK